MFPRTRMTKQRIVNRKSETATTRTQRGMSSFDVSCVTIKNLETFVGQCVTVHFFQNRRRHCDNVSAILK